MPVATRREEWNVLLCDNTSKAAVPKSRRFKLVVRPRAATVKNLIVFCSAMRLPHVSQLVTNVNRRNQLRALFLHEDADAKWLPQMLDRANLRAVRNLVVHADIDVPRRILNAWEHDAQDKLIARAMVSGNKLFVTSCVPETIELGFDALPALKRIKSADRSTFEIAADGSYIHWPTPDIHLDLSTIRGAIEPGYGEREAAARLAHDNRYGSAIAALRTERGLRQSDVPGLSERQVRRIEKGERPTLNALRSLAEAHELDLNEYLTELAARCEWSCADGRG
jgi:hypothetical protein